MDAALRLGHRHPLDPVRAPFVLEALPGVVALDHEGDLVEPVSLRGARGEDLDLPSLRRRVARVHLEEVLGEEVRLLASLGPSDLHDDVAAGIRVARHEQGPQLFSEPGDLGVGLGDLGLRELALVAGRVVDHLASRLEVALGSLQPVPGADDLFELTMAAADVAQTSLVRREVRIVELLEYPLVLCFELLQAIVHLLVDHGPRVVVHARPTVGPQAAERAGSLRKRVSRASFALALFA